MIIVQNFTVGDNYYTMAITEGRKAFGIIITMLENKPVYVEFMKFTDDGKDIVTVTELENPEEFKELKDKYFEFAMEYIKAHTN